MSERARRMVNMCLTAEKCDIVSNDYLLSSSIEPPGQEVQEKVPQDLSPDNLIESVAPPEQEEQEGLFEGVSPVHVMESVEPGVESSPIRYIEPELMEWAEEELFEDMDNTDVDEDYKTEEESDSSEEEYSIRSRSKVNKFFEGKSKDSPSKTTAGLNDERKKQQSTELVVPGSENTTENDRGKTKPWARAFRKERSIKINTGQSYISTSGKEVGKRELKPMRKCRNECFRILEEPNPLLRSQIFAEYWSLGSRDKRSDFISKCVTSTEVKTSRKREPNGKKKREITYQYCFEVEGIRKTVCKECFLGTLGEKPRFVRYTLDKKKSSVTGIITGDKRGKTVPPANKTTEESLNYVRKHILSFPSYKSHYSRRTNDKNYLPSHLNIQTMYDLYKKDHNNPVSIKIYTREFKTFNLAFKKPHIDTCHNCDTLHMKLKVAKESRNKEEELEVESQLNAHQEKADLAYICKKKDKEQADETKKCYSFDLQQCLPTPFLCSGVAFYKRQLWTYNLTIHDNATGESFNYMWHEATAVCNSLYGSWPL
ncbi:uncharacterized protein LOC120350295 [Nilaparvata lugens]|uniref:uncharacterized protein LOC120350295 n=1 Tax=Nilaparvata lugens TaxID=108931 RepID=UPI00193D59F4|nr:uncharacterized protein LOC120350295 [Nilaparvata lugens]